MNIVLKPVRDLVDAEILRKIRNDCSTYMTRNNNPITTEQQLKWFQSLPITSKPFILYEVICGVITYPIGYGFIRIENGEMLITGGLVEEDRGKGHGTTLFQYLLAIAIKYNVDHNLPIRLEVLKTNIKAFGIYSKLGFRVQSDNGKIITMEYYDDTTI